MEYVLETNTNPAIYRCRRRMGIAVEDPAIYPDMTARKNFRQQDRVLGLLSDHGFIDGGRMVKEMSLTEQDESLESFYMNLVGGEYYA